MNNAYIFGHDDVKDPFIGCFNSDSMKLSKLQTPEDLKIHTHMSVLYVGINSILLSGGVTQAKKISPELIMYHPLTNKFTQLPDLLQSRYAHTCVLLNGTVYFLGGRTYGCDFTSLTNSVESYCVASKEQKKCAPMQKRRCTFSSFVYQGEIWVLGGYSGSKRTKVIERYNPEKNQWKKCEIKLPRGIEGLQVFSYKPDEIILVGGNLDDGQTSSTHLINLKNKTIRFLPEMHHTRIMHKSLSNGQDFFVFGGDEKGTIERVKLEHCWEWEIVSQDQIDKSKFTISTNFSVTSEHNFSQKSIVVVSQKPEPPQVKGTEEQSVPLLPVLPSVSALGLKIEKHEEKESDSDEEKSDKPHLLTSSPSTSSTSSLSKQGSSSSSPSSSSKSESLTAHTSEYVFQDEDIHCMFGTDDKPFVSQIHATSKKVSTLACPIELRLMSYMAGTKISKNEVFICGGISSNLSHISRNCYIYNIKTNRAKKMPKMQYHRYAHQCVMQGDYVYALGGRGYQGDTLSLYDSNERFNLETREWEVIGCFSESKCSFNSIVVKDQIYAIGGYIGEGIRTQKIEKYNSFEDQWEVLETKLPYQVEASFVMPYQFNSILMFGGKGESTDLDLVKELKFGTDGQLIPEKEEEIGSSILAQLKVERCLQKCLQAAPGVFLVFGGNVDQQEENFLELVHLNQEIDVGNFTDLCSKISASFQFMNIAEQVSAMLFA